MASVRSGITQATRGGRWVVSRRNFCSSGKETKGAAARVGEGGRISSANEGESFSGAVLVKNLLPGFGYLSTGFLLCCTWEFFKSVKVVRQALEADKLAMLPSGSED